MAEFTREFNVERGSRAYRNFIAGLRVVLRATFSHNIPILPAQQNASTRWFDIILRTNIHWIRLRIQQDNLYVRAFQMENSQEWLEFGRISSSSHLIPESTFLGYEADYLSLQNVAGQCMDEIHLGQIQLTHAVNQLATSATSSTRARSLIIVIQMISESIRYTRITDFLAVTFSNYSSSPPPAWMQELAHSWGFLSTQLLRADANHDHIFQIWQPNEMNIVSILDAVAVLGIMLRS
ncbi:hypothetical protein CsSME_00045477 [Camellia sinensis var. sinensis]